MTGLIVLRLVHVLVGVFWVGSLVFVAGFLLPAVRAAGPSGGVVMQCLIRERHLHPYMVAATWVTILSGAALAWHDAGSLGFAWFRSGAGRMYGAGAVLALGATAIGLTVNAPTAQRLATLAGELQAGGRPSSPEQQRLLNGLQSRLAAAARIVAVLLLLAAATMAVARYVV